MIVIRTATAEIGIAPFRNRARSGITLTEILISIMIMGVGLVSLATLFPIGLLRLREAQRQTRSALLFESAAADVASRGLFNKDSFVYSDLLNFYVAGTPYWYLSPLNPDGSGRYNPLTHDTYQYGADAYDATNPGASSMASGGYGLPFAYDPLWRHQTVNPVTGIPGVYLDPVNGNTPEFRFADGTGMLPRAESDGNAPSAHGLQRLTNFNRPAVMGSASMVPSIFVSPEDVVWQESTNPGYTLAFSATPVGTPSTVIPDLSISTAAGVQTFQPTNDFRFSWLVTAQQTNGSAGAAFEGNVVIYENRPFAVEPATVGQPARAAGETVYEGVFGFSSNVNSGYGTGADRTVLIRWSGSQADPVVKVGDWIADVTYERNQNVVTSRFFSNGGFGWPNPMNKGEWDNLPAQRCFWYQVQKVAPAQDDAQYPGYRSMTVYVNRSLDAKTLLDGSGHPVYQNAVLVSPHIVNVIPQSFFVR